MYLSNHEDIAIQNDHSDNLPPLLQISPTFRVENSQCGCINTGLLFSRSNLGGWFELLRSKKQNLIRHSSTLSRYDKYLSNLLKLPRYKTTRALPCRRASAICPPNDGDAIFNCSYFRIFMAEVWKNEQLKFAINVNNKKWLSNYQTNCTTHKATYAQRWKSFDKTLEQIDKVRALAVSLLHKHHSRNLFCKI